MDKLKRLVLAILYPQRLKGLAIFLCHTKAHQWHKKLALNIHPKLPRIQRNIIFILSIISWYFAIFWFQLFIVFLRLKKKKKLSSKTIPDLLYLGLWIGAKPINYSVFNLNEVNKTHWIFYVFIEEQFTWYVSSNSDNNLELDIQILNDKYLFAKKLNSNNVPHVNNLFYLTPNTEKRKIQSTINELIQTNTNFFIKPQTSNAMRGCLIVNVDHNTINASGYDLERKKISITDISDLIDFIQNLLSSNQQQPSGVLFQPLLTNSDSMFDITPSKLATVLRIITHKKKSQQANSTPRIDIIYAFLEKEISVELSLNQWEIASIDLSNGKSNDKKIPQWEALIQTTIKAHELFPSITSIAWDVVLSSQGILIIEGNSGWNIIEPQRLCQKAALATFLE